MNPVRKVRALIRPSDLYTYGRAPILATHIDFGDIKSRSTFADYARVRAVFHGGVRVVLVPMVAELFRRQGPPSAIMAEERISKLAEAVINVY